MAIIQNVWFEEWNGLPKDEECLWIISLRALSDHFKEQKNHYLSLPSLLAYNTHFPGKFYIFSEYHSVKEAMKNIHYDKP